MRRRQYRTSAGKVSTKGVVPTATRSTSSEAAAERKRLALVLLAQGKNKSAIVDDMGLGSRQTLYNWLRDPDYAAEWERVEAEAAKRRDEELAEEMEDTALGLARGQSTKDGVPHWSAVRHMLGVTNPKRHGDKKQVEHTGTVVHTLIPQPRRLDEMLGNVIDTTYALDDGDEDEA